MAIPGSERSKLQLFSPENIPTDAAGLPLADLYVELPRNDRFIRYVCSGDAIGEGRMRSLARHVNPNFYIKLEELYSTEHSAARLGNTLMSAKFSDAAILHQKRDEESTRKTFSFAALDEGILLHFGKDSEEFLKKPIAIELNTIFKEIVSPHLAQLSLEHSPINELTDRLVGVITPEIANLRLHLKRDPHYSIMIQESSAITSIATLFAVARGQTSRSTFKDLSYACLFMDLSIADISEERRRTYYLDPESLSSEDKERIFAHPRRSLELVEQRLKKLPDIICQMIVGHHELFNGKGFPRQQRSEMLAPLVRILALAVDVFEFMKRQQLQGDFCDLSNAVEYFVNEPVEPHMRRHGSTLCREVAEFLRQKY